MNPRRRTSIRRLASIIATALLAPLLAAAMPSGAAHAAEGQPSGLALEALRKGGVVLVMRHATAPGVGDPAGFRVDDCSTQRNLSEAGRAEARRLGEQLRQAGIRFVQVSSSPWCRCMDTGELVFGTRPEPMAALASIFEDRSKGEAQTKALRQRVRDWRGPGNLAWVSHQVNISMLIGRGLASNEALVLVPDDSPDGFRVLDLH